MHFLSIIHIIGLLLTATGSSMLLPLLCSLYYGESDFTAILLAALITVGIGLPSWLWTKKHTELNIRDGIIQGIQWWPDINPLTVPPILAHPLHAPQFGELSLPFTTK
ncbi:MAG: hypothetical protein D3909_17330, partial [Candidatus Electrothrix sp. ATG1]|nr:hypothetical protein [Candidatus Electrothrix sp. ATG1]